MTSPARYHRLRLHIQRQKALRSACTIKKISVVEFVESNYVIRFRSGSGGSSFLPMKLSKMHTLHMPRKIYHGRYRKSFDMLLLALKRYMEKNDNLPPLNGSIPDKTSSTQSYIQ
eukprot:714352_1